MTPPTVLVVEDEMLVREVIAAELLDAGFDVIEAETAGAGLALLQTRPAIDLLFTDIRLPGGQDGLGLAREARQLRPELPVIYATGYTPDALTMVPGGRLLRKPYRAQQVLDAMAALGIRPPA